MSASNTKQSADSFPVKLRWEIAEALDKLAQILRDRPESVELVENNLQNLLVTIRRAKPARAPE